jgi:hypothetical protein
MKNIILEEINRFRFLSNYDNSKTSVENGVNLTEGIPGEALLKALESEKGLASTFRDELSAVGAVYDKLFKFLEASGAINKQAPAEQPADQSV